MRGIGYNITSGGEEGDTFSNHPNRELIREKYKIANLGRIYHPLSEEIKRRISKTKTGVSNGPCSDETKKKISEAQKGRKLSPEHRKKLSENHRKFSSEEAKRKMSEAWTDEMKEKQASRYKKTVICLETGVEYSCVQEAADILDLSKSSIRHNIHGRCKTVHGYTFKYKE